MAGYAPQEQRYESTATKIFLGNLSWETTDDHLRQHFDKYGAITDAVVMRDRGSGKPRGFGFVSFASSQQADAALAVRHTISGRVVDAKRCVPREAIARDRPTPPSSAPPARKLHVAGLSSATSDDGFRAFFERFGRLAESLVVQDHATGRPRGFGFVTFETDVDADRVLQAAVGAPLELDGHVLNIKRAEPKRSDPFFPPAPIGGRDSYQGVQRGGGGSGGGYDRRDAQPPPWSTAAPRNEYGGGMPSYGGPSAGAPPPWAGAAALPGGWNMPQQPQQQAPPQQPPQQQHWAPQQPQQQLPQTSWIPSLPPSAFASAPAASYTAVSDAGGWGANPVSAMPASAPQYVYGASNNGWSQQPAAQPQQAAMPSYLQQPLPLPLPAMQQPMRADPRMAAQQQQMPQPGMAQAGGGGGGWGGVPSPAFTETGEPTWLQGAQQAPAQSNAARYHPYGR